MITARKVFFDSAAISCKPNAVLSSRVYRFVAANGHEIVDDPGRADYLVVNTCGFDRHHIGITEKLYGTYLAQLKPGAKIVSIGCLNKIDPALAVRFPDVLFPSSDEELDGILSTGLSFSAHREAYVEDDAFEKLARTHTRARNPVTHAGIALGRVLQFFLRPMTDSRSLLSKIIDELEHRNKLFVEIGRGCVSRCSYCAIKLAKGAARSRPAEDILADIGSRAHPGKTVSLVADDCGSWGADTGSSLPDLLWKIHDRFPGIILDLPYLHPRWVLGDPQGYQELFRKMRFNAVNIPIQSGSDKILSLMNRNYSGAELPRRVGELRDASPDTLFWTHIIVGFPGETEADFRETLKAAKAYDLVQSFLFSEMEGTVASALADKVPRHVMIVRWLRLSICFQWNLFKRVVAEAFFSRAPKHAAQKTGP